MAANRLPASFFVSVAYDCWAFRRLGIRVDAASGAITKWLYRDPDRPIDRMAKGEGFPLTDHMARDVVLSADQTKQDAGFRAMFFKPHGTPLKAASTAEDIAVSTVFLASPYSRHVTGETLLVSGGLR